MDGCNSDVSKEILKRIDKVLESIYFSRNLGGFSYTMNDFTVREIYILLTDYRSAILSEYE